MQRKNFVPRVTRNSSDQLEKVGPNKNKFPERLLIKVGQNKTYAKVLEKIQKKVNSDTTGMMVKAVLSVGQVKKKERKTTLGMRDIESEATEEVVKAAIERAFGKLEYSRRMTLLKPNIGSVRIAIVILRPCKLQDQKEYEGSAVPQMPRPRLWTLEG
ncbi:hypothetical protein TSAR_002084 [Trichomalopsis sarcophagae]|uniref:Uncharacterized protein n=1 Tax=Trichomalopsis sarcophagae TaxID=543379 RepID=A0A232FE26_9HYME|nr:hypothetical protein TSAR_002084 [Trichomalopsis sarcophagae]